MITAIFQNFETVVTEIFADAASTVYYKNFLRYRLNPEFMTGACLPVVDKYLYLATVGLQI